MSCDHSPRIKSGSFNHQEKATHGVEVENLNAGKTTKRNAARSKAEAILVQEQLSPVRQVF